MMKHSTFFIGREIESETAGWLKKEKVSFEAYALIQIEFSKPDILIFSEFQNKRKQWVVSSQWAAKWLAENFTELGFGKLDSVFCLSEKQKEIVSAVSRNIWVSPELNAASLAQFILQKNKTEVIFFLQGNLSLNVLESNLSHLGNRFQKTEVYRNLPLSKKIEGVFDVYLFFSPGAVKSFYEAGNKIPGRSKIAVIGPTTAKTCAVYFDNEILVSGVQEELAFVKYAVEMYRQSELNFIEN
jgi:uroporphyrinogen-III synthase